MFFLEKIFRSMSMLTKSDIISLVRAYPEKRDSLQKDIMLVIRDHPGYDKSQLLKEIRDRYNYERKGASSGGKN
jgi:hypothetical protein